MCHSAHRSRTYDCGRQRWCRHAFSGDYKPGTTTTNYLAVVGRNTVWRPGQPINSKDVKDGLSSTILIVENRGMNINWMEPRDLTLEQALNAIKPEKGIGIGSHHRDEIHYVTVGGEVRSPLPPSR